MAYQEVTSTSYRKRIGNSFRGIGAGILMIVAGTVLLWWNEGRASDPLFNVSANAIKLAREVQVPVL